MNRFDAASAHVAAVRADLADARARHAMFCGAASDARLPTRERSDAHRGACQWADEIMRHARRERAAVGWVRLWSEGARASRAGGPTQFERGYRPSART